jgi:hypothetical protein
LFGFVLSCALAELLVKVTAAKTKPAAIIVDKIKNFFMIEIF